MKKTIINYFLILSLIFSVFSVFPIITSASGYISQSVLEYSFEENTLKVSISISNASSFEASVKSILAVKDSSGIVKVTSSQSPTINAKGNVLVTHSISSYSPENGDTVTLYLWDSNLKPICNEERVNFMSEGVLVKTYLSDTYYTDKTVEIVVTNGFGYTNGETYTFCAENIDKAALINLLGHSVTFKADGNNMVSICDKPDSNSAITVLTNEINSINENEIEYYETPTSKYPTTAIIDTKANINNLVVNGFNTNYDIIDNFFTYAEFEDADALTLLDNDNDGDFDFVFMYLPVNYIEFKVEEVETEYYMLHDKYTELYLPLDDEDFTVAILKKGEAIDFADINKNDIVTVFDTEASAVIAYVSSEKVEGMVDEIDGDTHLINETEYITSPGYRDMIDAGDEGTFYLNYFGQIAYREAIAPDYEYAYILDCALTEGNFDEDEYVVKVINSYGDEEIITLNSKNILFNGIESYRDEEAFDMLYNEKGIVKIARNDKNKITAILLPYNENFEANGRYEDENPYFFNEARCSYGTFTLTTDTPVYNVNEDDNTVELFTVGELFKNGVSYQIIAYGETDFDIPDVLVVFNADVNASEKPVEYKEKYIFLTDYATAEDDFGETKYYIRGIKTSDEGQINTLRNKNVSIFADETYTGLTAEEAYNIISEYTSVAIIATNTADEICEIYLPGSDKLVKNDTYNSENSALYSKSESSYGSLKLSEDAVIYSIESAEENLFKAVTARNVTDILLSGNSYSFTAYSSEEGVYDILVAYDLRNVFDATYPVMTVTKVVNSTHENKPTVKITGIIEGKTTSVVVSPDEYDDLTVEVGNVIIYNIHNNLATGVTVLFSSYLDAPGTLSEGRFGILANEYSDEATTIHYITSYVDATKSQIELSDDESLYFGESVYVTVIDYRYSTAQIKAGTISDCKTSARLKKTLFVKTASDEADVITDIVVFIENI